MSFAIRSALFCVLYLVAVVANGALVTQWNFNSSLTAASTGTGTASTIGGASATSATGSPGDAATPNNGSNLSSFPAATAGNGTAGSQFVTITAGFKNIVLSFDLRQSNTASKYFQLLVSSDGTSFSAPIGGTGTIVGSLNGNTGTSFSNSGLYANVTSTSYVQGITYTFAPGSSFENDANFKFKLVAVFDPANNTSYTGSNGIYGASGTLREDLVSVSGTFITAVPESPALLLGCTVCGVLGLSVGARKLRSRFVESA